MFDEEDDDGLEEPKKIKEQSQNIMSEEQIEKWLFATKEYDDFFCCMLYGQDGTGKSGIVQSFPLGKDDSMIILDLDGGNAPLLQYHKEKNIIVKNPLTTAFTENGVVIDYVATMNKIKATVAYLRENYKKKKIVAFCLDGLSTLLKHAEYQMRIEHNITTDGGVMQRYWIRRSKLFTEILEQIKALPIHKFFIAHEDFIPKDNTDLASVKQKTNQLVYQKLRCIRTDNVDTVIFKVIVDKNKFAVTTEGKEIEFCKVDKNTEKVKWEADKIFELLKKHTKGEKK